MIHVRPPIAPVTARHLPAVPDGFSLSHDEALSSGLRRLALEEFEHGIGALVGGSDIDAAVHEARKSMKRLRAMLRLIRDSIGEDIYRAENDLLRDTARILAPARDAAVVAAVVEGLRDRFSSHLKRSAFETLERRLVARHDAARRDLIGSGDALRNAVYRLRAAHARYRVWPTEDDEIARAYGRGPLEHSFDTISGGLVRTYRRGRREMALAGDTPTGHNFHQWRKRVKYLRHQIELLAPLWPEVMDGFAATLDRLGDLLGEEHDLSELMRLVAADPGLCADAAERTLISALAHHRRSELQTAAMTLGRRAYAEKPRQFGDRIGSYWDVWAAEA